MSNEIKSEPKRFEVWVQDGAKLRMNARFGRYTRAVQERDWYLARAIRAEVRIAP